MLTVVVIVCCDMGDLFFLILYAFQLYFNERVHIV